MSGIGGDFTGFHFNGEYSRDLGITRVSEGNRYNSEALPTRNAKTAQSVGRDGTYYWESYYTQKNFTINFAFDGLTEIQKRKLSKVFGTKEIVKFWFDEEPYKEYYVTVGSPLQLKTICFDENSQRIYKGEGSVQLIAYYPFALSRHKYLNEYSDSNKNEWKDASGMLVTKSSYDGSGTSIKLFNPGDLESDCYIYYNSAPSNGMTTRVKNGNVPYGSITLSSFTLASGDSAFRINSRSNVIEGLDSSGNLTGHIYNQYISSGDFFKIPTWTNTSSDLVLETTGASCSKIDYLYTYF